MTRKSKALYAIEESPQQSRENPTIRANLRPECSLQNLAFQHVSMSYVALHLSDTLSKGQLSYHRLFGHLHRNQIHAARRNITLGPIATEAVHIGKHLLA
jgi:hypothetical protein